MANLTFKSPQERLVIALDIENDEQAKATHKLLQIHHGPIKYGLGVRDGGRTESLIPNIPSGNRVIIDFKLHDIPRTVARAASQIVYSYQPIALTVHTVGGREMLKACVEATRLASSQMGIEPPLVLGITLLTSIGEEDWAYIGINDEREMKSRVMALAYLAKTCGLDGIVCSPREVRMIRQAFPDDFVIMVPGVRIPYRCAEGWDMDQNDHHRSGTLFRTIADGADLVVAGRPLINSHNPVETYNKFIEEIGSGLGWREALKNAC